MPFNLGLEMSVRTKTLKLLLNSKALIFLATLNIFLDHSLSYVGVVVRLFSRHTKSFLLRESPPVVQVTDQTLYRDDSFTGLYTSSFTPL